MKNYQRCLHLSNALLKTELSHTSIKFKKSKVKHRRKILINQSRVILKQNIDKSSIFNCSKIAYNVFGSNDRSNHFE